VSTRLVLWRHGRTEWNSARRFQGQTDIDLDDVGRTQAAEAARHLALLPPTRIISSDLSRARDTAAELGRLADLPVATDARLRETYAGSWQGLSREDLMAQHGSEVLAWGAGSDLRPGGGERRSEVAARMVAAIADALVDLPPDSTLVIATHGGSARAAVGALLGLPVAHWAILGVLTNCAWTVLTTRPAFSEGQGSVAPDAVEAEGDPVPAWRLEEYNARSLPETAFADDR
jgi:probable phosphoglycerate mutase